MGNEILSGVHIVDLTTDLAGAVTTHLLAEQGADVIKVEPVGGDPSRSMAAFATWNRSKRSVELDLRCQSGRNQLDHLLEDADVVLHDLPPSRSRALGLHDEALAMRFPHLIAASVACFPADHPSAEQPSADILAQARSGAMDELEGWRSNPLFLRFPVPSWSAVWLTMSGLLARLLVRERTGTAGPAHTSLYQGIVAVLSLCWNRAERPTAVLAAKIPNQRRGPAMSLTLFLCADGEWIHTVRGFTEHPLALETLAILGHEPIILEYHTPTREQLVVLTEMFLQRPSSEWLQAFREGDVPAAPIEGFGSVFRDPQTIANDYVVDVDDPSWGRVRQTLAPFRTQPPSAVRSHAPALGEHDGEGFPARRTLRPSAAYPKRWPLEGVKVLDFGAYFAGPFGTMMLADLGADVIKVEPTVPDGSRPLEALFVGSQRNKRALALDLTKPGSEVVLDRLLGWADVVHHNMRLSAAEQLGLGYERVHTHNPRIVYSHVSAYGHVGAKADWPGYDPTAFAASGWATASTPPGTRPLWYRLATMDVMSAMASVPATLLALFKRERDGAGSFVGTSMLGVATVTNSETMLLLDSGSLAPYPEVNSDQTGLTPEYRIYQVAEGEWIAVAACREHQLEALLNVAGVADVDLLVDALANRDASSLLAALDAHHVPAEMVRFDWEQHFFDDPGDSRLVVTANHPIYGKLEQPGIFWDFGDLELRHDRPAPLHGQHTFEILGELGLTDAAITKLVGDGVVTNSMAGAS